MSMDLSYISGTIINFITTHKLETLIVLVVLYVFLARKKIKRKIKRAIRRSIRQAGRVTVVTFIKAYLGI